MDKTEVSRIALKPGAVEQLISIHRRGPTRPEDIMCASCEISLLEDGLVDRQDGFVVLTDAGREWIEQAGIEFRRMW